MTAITLPSWYLWSRPCWVDVSVHHCCFRQGKLIIKQELEKQFNVKISIVQPCPELQVTRVLCSSSPRHLQQHSQSLGQSPRVTKGRNNWAKIVFLMKDLKEPQTHFTWLIRYLDQDQLIHCPIYPFTPAICYSSCTAGLPNGFFPPS